MGLQKQSVNGELFYCCKWMILCETSNVLLSYSYVQHGRSTQNGLYGNGHIGFFGKPHLHRLKFPSYGPMEKISVAL